VEAKPEDVGDKALIRVLDAQFRGSSGAVLCLRAGVLAAMAEGKKKRLISSYAMAPRRAPALYSLVQR
jgi:hypothetical protein